MQFHTPISCGLQPLGVVLSPVLGQRGGKKIRRKVCSCLRQTGQVVLTETQKFEILAIERAKAFRNLEQTANTWASAAEAAGKNGIVDIMRGMRHGQGLINGDGLIRTGYMNILAAEYHGADYISGGAGGDWLYGGAGTDTTSSKPANCLTLLKTQTEMAASP